MRRDDVVLIKGCIPFHNKREKLNGWKQIKQEFGDAAKILIRDNVITYTATMDRSLYF